MNDSPDFLEHELRNLRPATPRPETAEGIAAALAVDGAGPDAHEGALRRMRRSVALSWACTAAAAGFAIVVLQREPHAASAPVAPVAPASAAESPAALQPVDAQKVLLSARDDGVVYLPSGAPARKVRLEYVDTFDLRGPRDGAAVRVRVSVPREEIQFVPIRAF